MDTLSQDTAVKAVRKYLDEIGLNESVMYSSEDNDNQSLDTTIAKSIAEAINTVHLSAPVELLEGEALTSIPRANVSLSTDGVLSFTLPTSSKYLRLVAFQAADSPIVVTKVLAEASSEGRKQLKKYIRGRSDRPRLVLKQGRHTEPSFDYYSIGSPATFKDEDSGDLLPLDPDPEPSGYSWMPNAIGQLVYIKEQFYIEPTQSVPDPQYNISRRLRQNVLDCLTALVLDTFADQRSQSFYQKAVIFPSI